MAEQGSSSTLDERPIYFRPFTRDSLKVIRERIEVEKMKEQEAKRITMATMKTKGPQPDPKLEQGMPLPIRLAAAFDPDTMANMPLEDIDPFYSKIPTFVFITQKKDIFRFSATDAMWCLSPFNPVRRVAIAILTHGLFSLIIISTILANCYQMIMPASPVMESTEVVFTAIYTFESGVKVLARGFILEKFTYLRDAWNWLDFVVISLAYVTMGIDLGNLAALRTCRVFRALKTVAIVPGLKTIVGAVIESVKNLQDVIILTVFALSVFGLVGLQIYMGVLTQKCIRDFPEDGSEGLERDVNWHNWNLNFTNWHPYPPKDEYGDADYPLCGNSSGAGTCPENFTCLQGYGMNPNYGYTSFDSFSWAFLSAFRLMTQDFWESLYQQILRSAGPWHMLFFIVIIFLGSYYLVNLILAIVAMSYDELQKKAEEEEMAAAAELEAIEAEEEARATKIANREAKEAAAEIAKKESTYDIPKSTSGLSAKSSKSWASSQNRDKQSKPETNGDKGMVVLSYKEALEFLPYADDTPSDEDGVVIFSPFCNGLKRTATVQSFDFSSRRSSYDSHPGRFAYASSTDEVLAGGHRHQPIGLSPTVTKESQLIQRAKSMYGVPDKGHRPSNGEYSGNATNRGTPKQTEMMCGGHCSTQPEGTRVALIDAIVLNEIIDQAAGRPSHASEPAQEQEPMSWRARIKAFIVQGILKCLDMFCLWNCGFPWKVFQKFVSILIFDAFTELFITLMIIINTIFMAMDHYGLEENYTMNKVLLAGNNVFTVVFTLESSLKIIAMSPKYFFQVGWNVFDFIIVTFSLIEVVFEDANLPGLSALRSFRLLRVFKLAKSWPTLNMVMTIMGQTVGALSNLVFVFVIIIFIFAVMGMQLFAQNYFDKTHLFPGGEMPRWNFTDFGHSFLIVFRVLCGEWIESMWDCMLVAGGACVPFFLMVVVIGNLVVLNLFLALLLSSFGGPNLASDSDGEPNKIAEAFDRIDRFKKWVREEVRNSIQAMGKWATRIKNRIIPGGAGHVEAREDAEEDVAPEVPTSTSAESSGKSPQKKRARLADKARLVINSQKVINTLKQLKGQKVEVMEDSADTYSMKSYNSHVYYPRQLNQIDEEEIHDDVEGSDKEGEIIEDEDLIEAGGVGIEVQGVLDQDENEIDGPIDCMNAGFYERFPLFAVDDTPFGLTWHTLRVKTFHLIENKYFETAVIVMILLSSLALALEDVHLPNNPVLTDLLFYMDRIFTVIFFLEMLIKFLALGFVAYFNNAWCWLDFVIVMVSLVNFVAALAGYGNVQAFKTMRTLRALRPLRAMSRMEGMRIVVNALIGAIPNLINMLLVCLIFWLIFAILGVQLFNGKFHKCIDPEDGSRPDYRIIRNKVECLANNFTWENSVMNFDHVGKAYLCLFQVATFKGWIGIMNDAIDSREIDEQPHREVSFVMYIYFVIFIIFGSFFTLNLFVGVIIDNFNEQKKKSGGSMERFMTEDQKKYYAALQKMGKKKPIKAIPRPLWKPQAVVFDFVTNTKFDMVIMIFIGFNMLVMTMDHYQMSEEWELGLSGVNSIFVAIFTAECFMKIFAHRHHYFTEPWNLFDLVVVFMSIAGLMLSELIEKYFVSPTLLRVVRVAKVGRVLRLVKGAKGIRTLIFSLAMSLPALFNICLLLFLVMFIFSIFGMSFFMNVKLRGALDEVYNFQTFGQSIILLFQMSTSAGWDGVLDGIMNEDDCDEPDPELGKSGDCGNATAGIAFLLAYLVMSFLIIINMYIAVILENYSQATEDVQEGLTDDDYDMYYEVWAQFDSVGTRYIRYEDLSDFLDVLEAPLQIHKPNRFKIISMDLPICKGDMMYCVDILDALTKDFFARKGSPIEEVQEINDVTVPLDRPGYEVVSSTLWRQREEYCARLIQNVWRSHKMEENGCGQPMQKGNEEDKMN